MRASRRVRHGLSHYGHDCVLFRHAQTCNECLWAAHIDRGDWILSQVCLIGQAILDKEEEQIDNAIWPPPSS